MSVKRVTGAAVLLMLLLACAVLLQPVPTQAQPAASNQATATVFRTTYLTTTVNTAAPAPDRAGRDVSAAAGWGAVDIFVTADVSGTATLTATAQVSADGVNWTDADYEYWTGSAIGTRTQQRVQTADGTEYMTVKLAGEYWRVNMAVQAAAGNGVTTTVNATLHR